MQQQWLVVLMCAVYLVPHLTVPWRGRIIAGTKAVRRTCLSYCDNIKCDALLLFINGVRSNRTRPAAYFKTSNGSRLSVASKFRLSPQAVLYVKKNSSWTGNASQDVVKVRKCAERTQSFCALCTLVKHPRPAVHRSQRPCCTGMQHCGQWRFAAARDMRLGYFGRFAHW